MASSAAQSDPAGVPPWLERALVAAPPYAQPAGAEEAEKAARRAASGWQRYGSGIDPEAIRAATADFAAALRADPASVQAVLGVGRVARWLAKREPERAEAVLSRTIEWVVQGVARVAALQSSGEVHQLEADLRADRRSARERPKATSAQVDVVELDRDADGRVIRQQRKPTRFRPDTEELSALLPRALPPGERAPLPAWTPLLGLALLGGAGYAAHRGLHAAAWGALLAVGLLLLVLRPLVAALLSRSG